MNNSIYYVVTEFSKGKRKSYMSEISLAADLADFVRGNKEVESLYACKSKDEAEELAEYNNNQFRWNNTYLED